MPLGLLRYGLARRYPAKRFFPERAELRPSYDVVIIGGGGYGLAAAYYLARDHGITNVAVLERGWLAGGNTARNTAIIRSNYLTPEGVHFYDESVRLFQDLSAELSLNILHSTRGHLTLAHSDAALRTARWRAEVNKHLGVDSSLIWPEDIRRLCPQINLSDEVRYPVLGALYHPPGSIARHDAVAWGYARSAAARGVEIHTRAEVTGIRVEQGAVAGVETTRGFVRAGKVLPAVAGNSSEVARMAGLRLPIRSIPLQACVSEPYKPILDPIIVSGSLHVYISQSARGEFVMGGSTDPYTLYSTRSTLDFKEGLMAHLLELFPFLARAKVLRQWAGIADMTPDFSPVMASPRCATTTSTPAGAPGASRRRRSPASGWPNAPPPAPSPT
jgi:sarcosine oxidase subunit beta